MELVALLSTGKGTWGHVSRLIEEGQFDKVVLVTNDFGAEKFNKDDKTELVIVEGRKGFEELIADIKSGLDGKIGKDVKLNLVSGSGKEHMAILSVLKQMGVEYTLTALTKEGVKEL